MFTWFMAKATSPTFDIPRIRTASEILGGGDGSRGRTRQGQGGNNNGDDLHLLVFCLNDCRLNDSGLNDSGLNDCGLGCKLFLRWKADGENETLWSRLDFISVFEGSLLCFKPPNRETLLGDEPLMSVMSRCLQPQHILPSIPGDAPTTPCSLPRKSFKFAPQLRAVGNQPERQSLDMDLLLHASQLDRRRGRHQASTENTW